MKPSFISVGLDVDDTPILSLHRRVSARKTIMLKRKIPDHYNKFLIELGPRHKIASFRSIFSDHEALKRIKALREGYDWTTYLEISMLIPVCVSCKISADDQFGEQNLPEVIITNWQDQYINLGIEKNILCEMERKIRINNWKGLFCFKCGHILFSGVNEKFYIFSTPLTDYYGCQKSHGRSPTDWMKSLIFEEFGNNCNSCEQLFAVDDLTLDHILPWDLGGKTEFPNLQPLCQACNNKKANSLPTIIISHITAELLLPDLDVSPGTSEKRIDFSGDDLSHPLVKFFYRDGLGSGAGESG